MSFSSRIAVSTLPRFSSRRRGFSAMSSFSSSEVFPAALRSPAIFAMLPRSSPEKSPPSCETSSLEPLSSGASSASARRISSILSMRRTSCSRYFMLPSSLSTSSGEPADFSCFISSLSARTRRSFSLSLFVSIDESALRSFFSIVFLRLSGDEPSFSLADFIRLSNSLLFMTCTSCDMADCVKLCEFFVKKPQSPL